MWHQTIASRPTRVVTELNLLLQQNLNTFRDISPQVFSLKQTKGVKKQRAGRAPMLVSKCQSRLRHIGVTSVATNWRYGTGSKAA